MKTLITPAQVLKLAFADGEPLPPEIIAEADIAAAEARWIVPVIGTALYEKLLGGSYPDLRSDYLAAPLALFTRAAVQPRLDIRTGRCGTTAPRSEFAQPAAEKTLMRLRKQLLGEAKTLLSRAAMHLAVHNDCFPEYAPEEDVLNRCTTSGGIVMTSLNRRGGPR